MNALNMRLALIGTGVLLILGWWACGGTFGDEPRVIIEFGGDPDQFEGLAVEIDGEIVGRLERVGQATRNAFALSHGTHSVRVLHPDVESHRVEVTVDKPGQAVMFMLEFQEFGDGSGGVVTRLSLI